MSSPRVDHGGAHIAAPIRIPHANEPFLAEALWNQRYTLAHARPRLHTLQATVGRPTDLGPFQWAQLMAFALELRPDLILELGRNRGNSTCVFTEVANLLRPCSVQVISLCLSHDWNETAAKLATAVPPDWFELLRIHRQDIRTFDYHEALAGARRVLVFWDAHGFEVAECVLGQIVPLIVDREHAVLMHDISDARYVTDRSYNRQRLWTRNNWDGPRVRLGDVDSAVEQAVAIVDFIGRNQLTLFSADHSLHTIFDNDPARARQTRELLGDDLFDTQAHWRWFTLNEHAGPYTFPENQLGVTDLTSLSVSERGLSLYEAARCLNRAGLTEEALRLFRRVASPRNVDLSVRMRALYHLGRIFFEREDDTRALPLLDRVLRHNPAHRKAWEHWVSMIERSDNSDRALAQSSATLRRRWRQRQTAVAPNGGRI